MTKCGRQRQNNASANWDMADYAILIRYDNTMARISFNFVKLNILNNLSSSLTASPFEFLITQRNVAVKVNSMYFNY